MHGLRSLDQSPVLHSGGGLLALYLLLGTISLVLIFLVPCTSSAVAQVAIERSLLTTT